MQLTASTSLQAIRERLGVGDAEALRESEKRRRYLQKYARLLTTVRPTVRFSDDIRTATTAYEGDRPEITVTTRAFDQPVTDLRRRVFDLAVQEALVVHEIGHLRYTDIDGFHDLLTATDPDRRRLFARVWNTLEDGAVERQLRHRYAVATELDLLNANLLQTDALGHETPDDGGHRFSFFHAVICGLADMAIYDSGRFRRLRADDTSSLQMASLRDRRALEAFVPTMRETVQQVLTESDPSARNDHIWTFWTALRDALDEAAVSGAGASELARLLDADGTVRTGGQQTGRGTRRLTDASVLPEDGAGAPLPGKPDDTGGEFGQTTRSAGDLTRETVVAEVRRQVTSAAGSEETNANADGRSEHPPTPSTAGENAGDSAARSDGDAGDTGHGAFSGQGERSQGSGGGGREQDASSGDSWVEAQSHPGAGRLPGESPPEAEGDAGADGDGTALGPDSDTEVDASDDTASLAAAIREQYAEELAAEAKELDRAEARLAELDDYVDALRATGADDMSLRVVTDAESDGNGDAERWQTVRRDATRLARRFRSRLREQQRDVERSHRRRGTFDRSRLVAASRGQPDVFTQTEEGEDKQYTCVVVLDRSGSMDNGAVTAAETGALSATVALESVGVSVTILDLYESDVRLVKTGVEEARHARERVLTDRAAGGTPLASAMSLVRARFQDAENPFVIVVTDGQPDDGEAYLAELDAVTFPVLGVYLTSPDRSDRRPVESDRSYFHRLAVVDDWSSLDRRLQQLAGRVLF